MHARPQSPILTQLNRLPRLLLLTAVAVVGACGVASGPDVARIERLDLSAPDARDPRPTETLLARLEPPPEITPWSVAPMEATYMASDLGTDLRGSLTVRSQRPRTMTIPLPPETAGANRFEVALRLHGRSTMRVTLSRNGRRVVTKVIPVPQSNELTWIRADLLDAPGAAEACDTLSLELPPRGGTWMVYAVDVSRIDPAAAYPTVEEGPSLCFIESEGRAAVAVESGRPLVTNLTATTGDRISFSYAAPLLSVPDEDPIRLQLELRDEAGQIFHRDLKLDQPGWQTFSLELDGISAPGPGPLEARFTLEGERTEGFCLLGELVRVSGAVSPPTVLLITSDTHRADHLGSAGSVDILTPALDALAARGVQFERAWSSTNVTVPSHAALLTGTHPRDTGLVDNLGHLAQDTPTLGRRFQEGGYLTYALVSARHLDHRRAGIGSGFDRMAESPVSHQRAEDTIRTLEGWLSEETDKPLFVWLHLFDAHAPYDAPDEDAITGIDAFGNPVPKPELKLSDAQQCEAYRTEISYLDRELARVLASDRMRNGIVAFTADHGESLGAHNVYFNHGGLYPDTLHVPLILAWPEAPGSPSEQSVPRRVRMIDLGRTLLDLSALAHLPFPGTNLLDPGDANEPHYFLASGASSAAVLLAERFLVLHLEDHRDPGKRGLAHDRHEVELFDLKSDPDCLHELSMERLDEMRQLRALLVDWLDAMPDPNLPAEDATDPERLRELAALGYADMNATAVEAAFVDDDCECPRCISYAP